MVRLLTETLVFLPIGYIGGWVDTRKKSLFWRMWEHMAFGFYGRGKFKRVAETAFVCFVWDVMCTRNCMVTNLEIHLLPLIMASRVVDHPQPASSQG